MDWQRLFTDTQLLVLLCLEIGWMAGWLDGGINGWMERQDAHVACRQVAPACPGIVMLGGRIGTAAGSRVSLRNSPPSIAGEAAALAQLSLVGVGPLIINLETAGAASALADRHICPRTSNVPNKTRPYPTTVVTPDHCTARLLRRSCLAGNVTTNEQHLQHTTHTAHPPSSNNLVLPRRF